MLKKIERPDWYRLMRAEVCVRPISKPHDPERTKPFFYENGEKARQALAATAHWESDDV